MSMNGGSGTQRRVWIVEDSSVEAEAVRRSLEETYEVKVFAEATLMLDSLSTEHRPDLLILDIELPGMSGLDVCRFLRSKPEPRPLPIVLLTIYGSKENVVEGLQAGANDYVPKPFHPEELRARVAAILRTEALFERAELAERERAALWAEMERERERLQILFRDSPAGVCMLRGERLVCEFVNAEHRRLFGDRPRVGESFLETRRDSQSEALEASIAHIVATGERLVSQGALVRAGPDGAPLGQPAIVKLVYQPALDARGAVVGVDLFSFDVTEQHLGRRKMEDLLSLASHELKTPLTSLLLQLQLLQRELRGELGPAAVARLARGLSSVDRHARRELQLIDTLLDTSRLSTGDLPLEPEDLDVGELIRDVSQRFEEEAAKAGSELRVEVRGAVKATLDRLRLEQAVTNLVTNALKYGQGKPISLVAAPAGTKRLRVTVQDLGIGIGPEDITRVFGRFERAVSGRNYAGLGLGLWITRKIVEEMGGTISVQSELGEGSTFVLELPRTMPQAGARQTAEIQVDP